MRALIDVSAVPAQPVGAGVYTIAVARGLAARTDVEVHLLARRDDADRWADLVPPATVHPEAPNRRPARLVWEQTSGPRLARRVHADVWHGPHYTLPLRVDIPTVVTVHDLTFFDHPEWHERSKVTYFQRMIRAAVARATAVICVSEYTKHRLNAICGRDREVVAIPHGVDHERFTPANHDEARDEAALAEHGITPPYIAFSGTIEPRKDVPTLVRAFARIAGAHPDLRLVLAGNDGWGAADARDAIVASGVSTRILRPGYLENDVVAALFRRAEAVAYPSLEEGFGLPALEALSSGTPLVSTSGSAVEEIVGDAALLVEPRDDAALARALATIVDDPAEAERLRAAGPKQAADFTWERSVTQHAGVYARATRDRAYT